MGGGPISGSVPGGDTVEALTPQSNTIGTWDTARLLRFIKQVIQDEPPNTIASLTVDELVVNELLRVLDETEWEDRYDWRYVGQTGQPSFENSWANVGSPWSDAAFFKDHFGFVHLRGRVDSGSGVPTTIFTLPPGFRPPFGVRLICASNDVDGAIEIDTDGTVDAVSPSSTTYVSFDGLKFRVDQ